jgi:hypothetical protein
VYRVLQPSDHGRTYGNHNPYTDRNCNVDGYGRANGNCDCDGHVDGCADRDADRDAHTYGHRYCDANPGAGGA